MSQSADHLFALLDRFLKTKRIEGCTEKTLNAYCYELTRYFEFLQAEKKDVPRLAHLTANSVEDFLAKRPLESATRARMLAALRSFCRFLTDRDYLALSPIAKLKTPRVKNKVMSYLSIEEFRHLLNQAKKSTGRYEIEGRDYAILALFIGSGIRISELARLKIQDFDFSNLQIKVTRKGGKTQYIPFGKDVQEALEFWLEARAKRNIPKTMTTVFVSNRHLPMSIQTIRNVVKKWMKRSDLWGKRMSPHTLRHSYATAQITLGTPVQVVQDLLGHNQLNTTSKYLHLANGERRKAAEKIKF